MSLAWQSWLLLLITLPWQASFAAPEGDAMAQATALLAPTQPPWEWEPAGDESGRMTEALALAERSGDLALLARALEVQAWWGTIRMDLAATDAALARWSQLPEAHQPMALARRNFVAAVRWRRAGQGTRALELLEQTLASTREWTEPGLQIAMVNQAGRLRRRSGALYQALADHQQALSLARLHNLPRAEVEALTMVGRIYAELDDYEQAGRFYQQALAQLPPEAIGARAEIQIDAAAVAASAGDLAQSRALAATGLAAAEQLGDAQLRATAYNRQARLALYAGDPAAALDWMDRSIAVAGSLDGVRSIVVRQASRARILLELDRAPEAVAAISAQLPRARASGDRLLERDLLELDARARESAGDATGALAALKAFVAIENEVQPSLSSRRIADLEASLQRAQSRAELELLGRERDLERLRAQRRSAVGIGLGVGMLLLAALGLTLWARMRTVRRMHDALAAGAEQLRLAAHTDPLTGLANRLALARQLAQPVRRQAPGRSVILLDVDLFKQINDRHGHPDGDRVLQAVATRLREAVEHPEAGCDPLELARWGGEEFLLLATSEALEPVARQAEQMRAAVASVPVVLEDGSRVAVTVSIGTSWAGGNDRAEWPDLVRAADAALYRAKAGGRDRVCAARPEEWPSATGQLRPANSD